MAIDGDANTYWTPADGVTSASIEVDLGQTVTFDRATIQEANATKKRHGAGFLQPRGCPSRLSRPPSPPNGSPDRSPWIHPPMIAAMSTEVVSTFAPVAPKSIPARPAPFWRVCAKSSDWHAVLHVQPTTNWKQSILAERGITAEDRRRGSRRQENLGHLAANLQLTS